MLYLYGTVYNNANRVLKCLDSLNQINTKKKFLIIDNYSTDGTYELLKEFQNIELKRVKCSRGLGRQLAMELARDQAEINDLFMTFDLDTIYSS
jgi:glycosyltransferase involved in cell wall biosynthesis